MHFNIQVDKNNLILFDFQFHLIKSIEYLNWFYNQKLHSFSLVQNINFIREKGIPIGSLEFVEQYISEKELKKMKKPINVPEILFNSELVGRKMSICFNDFEIKENYNNEIFAKSDLFYKKICGIYNVNDNFEKEDYPLLISDLIEIDSEYRIMIHQNEIRGIQHYSGDFIYPDLSKINQMIVSLKELNMDSYTLDVLINNKGTFILEIHPFVSCGLYGFSDYRILCDMFINGYNYILE